MMFDALLISIAQRWADAISTHFLHDIFSKDDDLLSAITETARIRGEMTIRDFGR
jgi:hypothetical protein